MEKHTRGIKTNRIFFKNHTTNEPYELITIVDDKFVMRNLITGNDIIYEQKNAELPLTNQVQDDFVEITQDEVFDCIDNNDDELHDKLMKNLGIGNICPFCGGKLYFDGDFRASNVYGMSNTYIEITNPQAIELLNKSENQYICSRLMGVTEDIEKEKIKVKDNGYYEFKYLRENKGDNYTYYEIDDSVICIYHCVNCGKSYEIQDCPLSKLNDK